MTELKEFLASLYDSLSEAEMMALQHGQARLLELLKAESIPEDAQVPVYHATDVEVQLEVGLETEQTDEGLEMYVTESPPEDGSTLSFSLELFELLDKTDLEKVDYERFLPAMPQTGVEEREQGHDYEKDESDRPERRAVDVLQAIGPAHATELKSRNIETLSDLLERTPEELAAEVSGEQAEISPDQTREWIDEARGLLSVLSEREGELPVELVDGIGPTFGRRLREAGVEELADLVEYDAEEIARLVSTDELSVSAERTAEWLTKAREHLEAFEAIEEQQSAAEGGTESSGEATADTEENQ